MMQRFWSWLAVELGRRAGLFALVGLIITLALGYGATRLEFATGQDSYLNASDQVYKDSVAYQHLFGGQAVLGLVTMDEGHTADELFDAEGLAQWRSLHDDLSAARLNDDADSPAAYLSVATPLIGLEYTDILAQNGVPGTDPTQAYAGQLMLRALAQEEPGSDAYQIRQEESLATLQRANAVPADQRTMENPDWIDFLLYDNHGAVRQSLRTFFDDERHASVIVRLPGNLSIDDEGRLAVAAKDRMDELHFPNATVTATGVPILLDDLNHYLRGGMLMLGGIAVAIMTLILLIFFKVRWRLLPLVVILVGVVWAFGLAGYLGIPLTVVTIAGLPVMLGVGIDYAIQMHARVEEEVVLDRAEHPIQETARNLGPALLVVTFDAVFAFAALGFARVPMIRDFGALLAVGIAVICLNSIVMPLATLGAREHRSPTQGRDFRHGVLGRLTLKLGSLPQSFALPLAIASVAIFVGGVLVEDQLVLQTDPVQWVNQGSDTIQDIHTLEREVGTSAELGVFVQSDDVFTDDNVGFMYDVRQQQLGEFGPDSGSPRQLLSATSIEEILTDVTYYPGTTDYVPTGDETKLGFAVAPPDLQRVLATTDGAAANIVFRVGPGSIDDLAPVVDGVRDNLQDAPAGTTATPSGIAVIGVGLLENLESNRVLLTYLSMAFVFGFLAIRLRSIVRALLSLVPVAIAVGAASLVAYALGLELSPMTAVGGPLVIAACTEFTSLILLRFVEERGRGIEPQEAVDVVAVRTGRAFIVSGMTAIAGVAVLSFSSLPLLRDFGRVVAMNVAVALLSALVVLPPLLVWAERRELVSRGLVRPPEPFIDTAEPAPTID
jgi:uncharacterized protein